jgi:hypothetical protein
MTPKTGARLAFFSECHFRLSRKLSVTETVTETLSRKLKHGKPVVKLIPANEGEDEIFGALAGIARIKGDIENTVPASDWEVE